MEELYKEALERLKYLEKQDVTSYTNGQKYELELMIVRIQQLLLKDLNNG